MHKHRNNQIKKGCLRVLIAASGSGGHLLPARYVAEELKAVADVEIEFCGTGRYLEKTLIADYGYKINKIPIVGLSRRGIKGVLQFITLLPWAWLKTCYLLLRFKPDVIFGVGGYVSVLPILIGKMLGKKCIIHEAETTPGMANKFLAKYVDLVTTAQLDAKFPDIVKTYHVGQPLNPELFKFNYIARKECQNILIFAGSQGSNSIDQAMLKLAAELKSLNVKIKHQARPENISKLLESYQAAEIDAEVFSFSNKIPEFYSWADLIIARSGLNTVQELDLVNKRTVLVPLPKAPEQMENAEGFIKDMSTRLLINEDSDLAEKLLNSIQELAQKEVVPIEKSQHVNSSKEIAIKLLS